MIFNITALLKPKLRPVGRRWKCYDALFTGTGSTPQKAYDAWKKDRYAAEVYARQYY